MDNLTHSLIGLATGELCYSSQKRISKKSEELTRPTLLIVSVVANNMPDLDIFLNRIYQGPLNNLLQHRGFTHTLVGAIPQTAILMIFVWLTRFISRRKKLSFFSWKVIAATSILGLFTHILADSWNSYGVHPFWPFSNTWYYGDAIFIAEPWIWITLLAGLFSISKRVTTKYIYSALVIAIFAFILKKGLIPLPILAAIAIWGILVFLFINWQTEDRKPLFSILGLAFIVLAFHGTGQFVRAHAQEAAWQKDPEAKLLDMIISPLPGNFLCWSLLTVKVLGDPPVYKLQSGYMTNWPAFLSPEDCMNQMKLGNANESRIKKSPNDDPKVIWTHSFKTPLEKFTALYNEDCLFREFLKFARAPYFISRKQEVQFGDYRFEHIGARNFSQMTFPRVRESADCPKNLFPWGYPRTDLIGTFNK